LTVKKPIEETSYVVAEVRNSPYSDLLLDRFGEPWPREVLHFLCDERLGRGMTREVFRFGPDPSLVIKFEMQSGHFQNVAEWHAWHEVSYAPDHAKWFARCHYISHGGLIMLQEYVEPIAPIKLPVEVPAYFADLKASNWGWRSDKTKGSIGPVCFDYGKSLLLTKGLTKKMQKALWT
jgi:hypothetical protein